MRKKETPLAIWTSNYDEWDRLRRQYNPLAKHCEMFSDDDIRGCCAYWDIKLKDGWLRKH